MKKKSESKFDWKRIPTRKIVLYALLTALTTAATIVIQIPMVATEGYINIGDTVLMYTGIVFGPIAGFIAGGLGSCLADLAAGYAHWVLPTFLIKGLEGALVGLLFMVFRKIRLNKHVSVWISMLPAAVLMVLGYFIAYVIMKGSAAVAWTSVPGNCLQGLVSMVLCYILLVATSRIRSFSRLTGKNNFYDMVPVKSKKGSSNDVDESPKSELTDNGENAGEGTCEQAKPPFNDGGENAGDSFDGQAKSEEQAFEEDAGDGSGL